MNNNPQKFKDFIPLKERIKRDGKPLVLFSDGTKYYAMLGNTKINFSEKAQEVLENNNLQFDPKDYRVGKMYLESIERYIDLIVPNLQKYSSPSENSEQTDGESNLYFVGKASEIYNDLSACLAFAFGRREYAKIIHRLGKVKIVNFGFPPKILYNYLSVFFSYNDLTSDFISEITTVYPDITAEEICHHYFPNTKHHFYNNYIDDIIINHTLSTEITPLVIYFIYPSFDPDSTESPDEISRELGRLLRRRIDLYEMMFTFDINNTTSPLDHCNHEYRLCLKKRGQYKRYLGVLLTIINRLKRKEEEYDEYNYPDRFYRQVLIESMQTISLDDKNTINQLYEIVKAVNMGVHFADFHLLKILLKNKHLIWNVDDIYELEESIAQQGILPVFNKIVGLRYYKKGQYYAASTYLSKYIILNKNDEDVWLALNEINNIHKQYIREQMNSYNQFRNHDEDEDLP